MFEGIAVGSTDGVPDVPGKPARWCCPLAGVIAGAAAEAPPFPPHAASSMMPAVAAPVAATCQGLQWYG